MKALKKYLGWIAVACAVVAVIACALPFFKQVESGAEATASGFTLMFGGNYVMKAGGMKMEMEKYFGFSVMNLLPLLLVVAGAVCAYLGKKNGNKIMNYVAIGCFAVAAILFFCAVSCAQMGSYFKDMSVTKEMWKESLKDVDLGIGAVLAGIVSLVGAAAVAVDTFVPVKE